MSDCSNKDKEIWKSYITGGPPPHVEREMEERLLHDDYDLEQFLHELDDLDDLPVLTNPDDFADRIMLAVEAVELPHQKPRHRRWVDHPLFHYAIAACLMIFFFSSGLADNLLPHTGTITAPSEGPGMADQIMKAAVSWLDRLKP
ncbi:hypothetical protein Q5741_01165 [Paenibacillus sp. JX-17]|uniref:Anti-sigma factor n=1 Tax=Paenibacillus lacisoli TaxID=3064525 RepID=A0ABT9C8L0_9BACL|nr:hypothetical protein [Paenibacillus sp. JX-17]MDO7905019.1 hypothetical protein [Paenibacillus sp. JX-17]